RVCIDGSSGLVKAEFGIGIGEVETGLEKCADCSDVLPISLKNIGLHLVFIDGCWNDILAEIGEVIVEAFLENAAIEHIDTHRGLVEVGIGRLADGLPEIGGGAQDAGGFGGVFLFYKTQ